MALKIRLRQQGRTNLASFRFVVTDVRSPRDGRYVEALGWYNPEEKEEEKQLSINQERIQFWLDQGALPTESAGLLIARVAPEIAKQQTQKALALKVKAREKRKARKAAA